MHPNEKPNPETVAALRGREPKIASAGPVGEREGAKRALAETREALKSGEIAGAGEKAARDLEMSLAGKPERGDLGEVVARVVAVGDRRSGVPAVPLEGVPVRLKVDGKVIAEASTGQLGLVSLPLGAAGDVAYEVEALGADCAPAACQPGRVTKKSGADTHLIELARTDAIKPQLERAQPFENSIRAARERAALGRAVMTKALTEQEKRLVEYLAALKPREGEPRTEAAAAAAPAAAETPATTATPAKTGAPATTAKPARTRAPAKGTSRKGEPSKPKSRVVKPPNKRGGN